MMLRRALTIAAFGLAAIGSAHAQTADENRDADALAADMRILAANPLDIEALIVAGELTLKMGDNTAAATFFGRAEKLDPLNPRIKVGWGTLMLRAERPGEALRRFGEAQARGLDPRKYAADRGLAYDLIGEQDRAQRDYRLALQSGPDDEITRRYALSLGISGRKELALKQLDSLLRRSDRAAWRDRAFILAMNGDTDGAEKIAASMMSPGLGAGLAPFFQRLPQLSPADRAFAVTFGDLRPTPERIADAKLVPPLPKLAPDPTAPRDEVAVAALPKPVTVADDRKRKKRKKDDIAPAVPTPAPAPVDVALTPPKYVPPVAVAALPPRVAPVVAPTPAPLPAPVVVKPAAPVRVAEAPKPVPAAPKPAPSPAPVKVAEAPKPAPTPAPTPAPVILAAADLPKPVPVVQPMPVPSSAPVAPAPDPIPGTADRPTAAEAGVPEATTPAKPGDDKVLAKIVFDLTAPKPAAVAKATPAEPKVEKPKPDEPKSAPVGKTAAELDPAKGKLAKEPVQPDLATGKGKSKLDAAPDAKGGKTRLAKGEVADDAKTAKGAKSDTGKEPKDAKGKTDKTKDEVVALDKNGCPLPPAKGAKGKAATAKAKAPVATTAKGKKTDARCKTADAKDKESKADQAAKGEPARVWVQVAGGANEASLEKAWAAQKAKAPDLFRGRQGWSTPLRNTNRVLTGPFKSEDDAQEFVNKLSKAGLSGFVFTSTKGQKIERLGSK